MSNNKAPCLAVSFTCPSDIEVGDPVVISSSDYTVAAISAEADVKHIGTVVKHEDSATTCTVETKFRERRDDRTAAAVFANGPFVWDATGKAAAYTAESTVSVTGTETGPYAVVTGSNDKIKLNVNGGASQTFTLTAAANAVLTGSVAQNYAIDAGVNDKIELVIGTGSAQTFTLTAATKASVTGTQTETFAIVLDTSDKIKIKVGDGDSQTFTLTAGGTQTAANVVADLAALVDATASVSAGAVKITCDSSADTLEIEAVANDAYTVLGLTAAVTSPTLRTAANIVSDLAALTDASASVATDKVRITATDIADSITINEVANDTYATLGFTEGVTTPTLRTASQIVTDLAAMTDATASVASNHVKITADTDGDTIEIETIANDAYTLLGFTESEYSGESSHSPAAVAGVKISDPELCVVTGTKTGPFAITLNTNDKLKISIGGATAQTVTLTAGTARTATQIAEDINATATDVTASAYWGAVRLTADAPGDSIAVQSVTYNSATTLGFTVGTTAAPMIINTLEY